MAETKRHVLASVGALVLALSAGSAEADGSRVLDAERKVEATSFASDVVTGRAWVDVTVARRFASGKEARAAGTRVPVQVNELAYDASAREIVLVDGTTRTTCATFPRDEPLPTGACVIVATVQPRAVDTGFGSAVRDHLVVRVVRRDR